MDGDPEVVEVVDFADFLGDVEVSPPVDAYEEGGFTQPGAQDDAFLDEPVKLGDGECVVCGAPTFRPPGLTKTGRKKRAPKYCDIHASNVRIPEDGPVFSGVESQLRHIQEELADDIKLLGTLAGPLLPVTGYYVVEHADPFTTAILKLAKNNQRILRVLHRAASVAPIYTVAECVAGTACAIQVDQQKLDPRSNMARRLGVTHAYDSVYPNQYPSNGINTNGNGFQGPPKYATVQ